MANKACACRKSRKWRQEEPKFKVIFEDIASTKFA